MPDADRLRLWAHVYGPRPGTLALFSVSRGAGGPAPHTSYFQWPDANAAAAALRWVTAEDAAERDVYHCAHLLTAPPRRKENAADVSCLWVEHDGGAALADIPQPTARVQSSPGHEHRYWRLAQPIPPERAEDLNQRLGFAVGADPSGWDLSQLLRVPRTHNHKYDELPLVTLLEVYDVAYDANELDRALPPAGGLAPTTAVVTRPDLLPAIEVRDLGLSEAVQRLIWEGPAANPQRWQDRSTPLFVVERALIESGADDATISAVLMNPAHGISAKPLERGLDWVMGDIDRTRKKVEARRASGYAATAAGLVRIKQMQEGPVTMPLTNFTAEVVADVVEDDGSETRRAFEIEAHVHGVHRHVRVPAAQFGGMTWVTEQLGISAVILPGFGIRDHARAAIQLLSDQVEDRTVYAHTGWRLIDGEMDYLHAGGAPGADGPVPGIEVALPGTLAQFALPPPPDGEHLREAVRASLALLDLAPMTVTAPVLGATYEAPLREFLGANRPDHTVWVHGPSGVFKSELATLMEAHFGPFDRQTLPASFAATANAVERMSFQAKDLLLVVDDYHPAGDRREEWNMEQVASRVLRGQGNGSGRPRMRADTTLRPEFRPRCIVLATGERLPTGYSNSARMFPVPLPPGAISTEKLSRAQEAAPRYAEAMAAYVQWLAVHHAQLHTVLPARLRWLRDFAKEKAASHTRAPGQIAHLALGLDTVLRFAVSKGAVNRAQQREILLAALDALVALDRERAGDLEDENPVARFLALLADGFAARRIYVTGPEGRAPAGSARAALGWEPYVVYPGETEDDDRVTYQTAHGAQLVGMFEEGWLLLFPEVVFQYVVQAARTAGQVFPVEQATLRRRLHDAGVLEVEGGGRLTVRTRIGGTQQRVLKLKAAAVFQFQYSPG